ncbi:alpha-amylase family protein [Shewanella sp. 202IG2-18]|uniref:alpha-amylase family protein n=1 Tax=Parashewanella hymeniacidonis TaxID=2807618 RepID=UPI00195FE607|nr:alpha-amylase family protein [Parashewanella hymeniacidonis]MBM7072491.1 alpha-amylase family protein [Parashewanella hymeniacidonis]
MLKNYFQAVALTFSFLIISSAHADVILHAFNWKYSEVANKAEEIAQLGYKKVLVSPAYKSTGDQWWSLYQPQDYRVIDNRLGDTNDFKNMVKALKSVGVETYADIVFNDMANESLLRSDLNYPGNDVLNQYASDQTKYQSLILFGDINQNLFSENDFFPAQCIHDYNNVDDVQHNRICGTPPDTGLPKLAYNDWVVSQQQSYLKALKAIGVTGFRIDAAKHMTIEHLNKVFTPKITKNMHIFGELITSGGKESIEYKQFLAPYLDRTDFSAYDFPLFSQIREAFSYNGSLNSLAEPKNDGHALDNSRAVTFVITHDIPMNAGFRYQIMNPTDETLASVYVLGRDGGVPLIYSDHNESHDNARWQDFYKRKDIIGMIKFHNATQGTQMHILSHDDCSIVFSRGSKGVLAINKCAQDKTVSLDFPSSGLKNGGVYQDMLSSDSQPLNEFVIHGRDARMWLLK